MFLTFSQNSQENTCARVSFLMKFIKELYLKKHSDTGAFLRILRNLQRNYEIVFYVLFPCGRYFVQYMSISIYIFTYSFRKIRFSSFCDLFFRVSVLRFKFNVISKAFL